jgi:hypothetical protein
MGHPPNNEEKYRSGKGKPNYEKEEDQPLP